MAASSLLDHPNWPADLIRVMLDGANSESAGGPARLAEGGGKGANDRNTLDQRWDSRSTAALVDPPRLICDSALDREYLVIPLRKDAEAPPSDHVAGPLGDGRTAINVVELILADQRARQQAERERDELADRIAQDFEELHWLRALALTLSASDATTDLETVAHTILPDLRQLVGAEAFALVPVSEPRPGDAGIPALELDEHRIVWDGDASVSTSECLDLVRQFGQFSIARPVVFNRESPLRTMELTTTARNLLAVALTQGERHYGWLIALNRVVKAEAGGPQGGSDRLSPEFGSHEVGIMTTAAGMLAGQARNIELFRAGESLRLGIIETVTGAIDARDPYTCGHSRRVAQMATQIAAQLGFPPEQQHNLYLTGLMHDVGKIGIPDAILRKNDRLTDEEFNIIQQHPTIGCTILSPLSQLAFVLPGVLHHHERYDGRGYPHGLARDEIPLDARILAVADSYDAMTSDRAYRRGMPAAQAIARLHDGAGTQFDPAVVDAFLRSSETQRGREAPRPPSDS